MGSSLFSSQLFGLAFKFNLVMIDFVLLFVHQCKVAATNNHLFENLLGRLDRVRSRLLDLGGAFVPLLSNMLPTTVERASPEWVFGRFDNFFGNTLSIIVELRLVVSVVETF